MNLGQQTLTVRTGRRWKSLYCYNAGVVELVDTRDLKVSAQCPVGRPHRISPGRLLLSVILDDPL